MHIESSRFWTTVMTDLKPFQEHAATSATAEPVAEVAVSDSLARWSQQFADGGEAVIFAIKPSAWRPVIDAAPTMVMAGLLIIAQQLAGASLMGLGPMLTCQLTIALGCAPLVWHLARWAGTWYVLTSRRLLTIRGISRPRMDSVFLTDVSHVQWYRSAAEVVGRWGSVHVQVTDGDHSAMTIWRTVTQPADVCHRISQAVRNAKL